MTGMNNSYPLLLSLLFAMFLSGCAGSPSTQAPHAAKLPENPLLYNAMIAEIAGHRGDLERAVEYYKRVIESTNDLDIMRRASRIMLFAKDYEAANKAIQRWLQLAPEDIEVRQAAATTSLQQGDVATSIENLEWLLRFARDDELDFKLLAALLGRVPDKKIAAAAMEEMVSRYPHSFDAKIIYARLAFASKQYEKALHAATDAARLDDANTDAGIILARAQIELGNTEDALLTLDNLLRLEPNNDKLRLTYARVLMTINRYESSIKQFEVLIKRSPERADLIYSAAIISIQLKSYTAAEGYLKKLISLGKHQQEAWFYLGRMEEKRKHFDKAQNWYARVDTDSLYLDAQMGAARVQGKAGQLEGARKRYAVLRDSHPEFATSIWLSESEMLREIHDDQGAFELLDTAIKSRPEDIDIRYSRALAAERIDRLDILESDLKLVLDKEPEHAHALNALGYTLADRTDRIQEALGYIQKAFRLEPNDPAIIDSMGWVQYRLGNLDKAIEYLQQANKILKDGEVAAHLGEVLWVRGDRDAANRLWMNALREYPDSKVLIKAINRFKP